MVRAAGRRAPSGSWLGARGGSLGVSPLPAALKSTGKVSWGEGKLRRRAGKWRPHGSLPAAGLGDPTTPAGGSGRRGAGRPRRWACRAVSAAGVLGLAFGRGRVPAAFRVGLPRARPVGFGSSCLERVGGGCGPGIGEGDFEQTAQCLPRSPWRVSFVLVLC